jgi:hypothetical protein
VTSYGSTNNPAAAKMMMMADRPATVIGAALFRPVATALPDRPVASLPLTHPALVTRLAGAARRLGYTVI